MINKFFLLIFFSPLFCVSQTLSGKVIDKVTQQPIETVSVYFDNTTIGTTTDEKGEFLITYTDAVQSTLVISYLGYEKVLISDYRNTNTIKIELIEAVNELDEVIVNADDGMTRAQKLMLFRREFLGKSENAKSCKILNEKDLKFRYNKRKKILIAWSNRPIQVKNKNLKYEVNFEIIDFEIVMDNIKPSYVFYTGTSFFKDLNIKKKKKVIQNREKTFNGSIQHFIRSLYNESLEEEGYIIGYKRFKVNPYAYFSISSNSTDKIKTVKLLKKVDIYYKDSTSSTIEVFADEFSIDSYGNYSPISSVMFSGHFGTLRIGDTLPLDYGL